MRLIDADAYKKHLASFVVGGEKAIVENGIGNYWIDGIHTAYREIDNAPTIKTFTLADIEEQYQKGLEKGLEEARPHGEWIPVSERLPEENKTVIASTKYDVFPEAMYTKEDGWAWAYESGADYWEKLECVTAWMPLPEPYKEEGDAE